MRMIIKFVIVLSLLVVLARSQFLQNARFRQFPMKAALNLKNRLKAKFNQYRERTTQQICYETVGCFNLPHKNSPLQKVPEDPRLLDTKFYLFTRNTNFLKPEILYYDDGGESLTQSTFNFSKPLKMIIHGYIGRWNEKGSLIVTNAYLKMYDCNVILMDWNKGARGPQYALAAANTELVGRQLGMLLTNMVENGMDARKIHLIGFSLGAHVAGTASESLKKKDFLIGRITGLDPASPLFRNNYFREQYKKLDRSDAKFVDVIHTDGSPFVTDGFGLWEPTGHVDFFPNGGQEQPGCNDIKDSIVVSHFERGLSREIVCSHIRAFFLFRESVVNLLSKRKENRNVCEFIAYNCPGGVSSFENGHCFPQLDNTNDTISLDPSYRFDIGRFGEDAVGEGVMYFSTKSSSQFCGTQLQASVQLSPKTSPIKGLLQLQLIYSNHTVTFQINCEFLDITRSGTLMNALSVADYSSLTNVHEMEGRLSYLDLNEEDDVGNNQTIHKHTPMLYFDKIVVRDMHWNSWEFCKKDTVLEDQNNQHYNLLNVTLRKSACL